jgi:hypothetical protein
MNNALLKHLYSTTSKVLLTQSDRINENFEKADKIIIWIVGFSIGIFVLLISQKSKNGIITDLTFEISIYSLIVVILGLLFRICSFFTQIKYSTIIVGFISFAEGFVNTPEILELREIDENESAENLIEFLKNDFDADFKEQDLSKMSTEKIEEYRGLLLNYYRVLAEPRDTEKQLEKFKTNFANHFGFSKKYMDKRINNENRIKVGGLVFRGIFYLSMSLFFLTIGTFILGIGVVLKQLIESNCG